MPPIAADPSGNQEPAASTRLSASVPPCPRSFRGAFQDRLLNTGYRAECMKLAWIFSPPLFSGESLRATSHSPRNSPARTSKALPSKKRAPSFRAKK